VKPATQAVRVAQQPSASATAKKPTKAKAKKEPEAEHVKRLLLQPLPDAGAHEHGQEEEMEVKVDYGSHSLVQLKDACRAKGLPVWGGQGSAAGEARGLEEPLWLSPK
jgi:cytoskeletal protein RodZ